MLRHRVDCQFDLPFCGSRLRAPPRAPAHSRFAPPRSPFARTQHFRPPAPAYYQLVTMEDGLGTRYLLSPFPLDGAPPNNCDCWLHGYWNKRPRKWSWNLRHNTGNPCGPDWNATGSRCERSERVHVGGRERCIWRQRSPIADGEGASGIFRMPNVW